MNAAVPATVTIDQAHIRPKCGLSASSYDSTEHNSAFTSRHNYHIIKVFTMFMHRRPCSLIGDSRVSLLGLLALINDSRKRSSRSQATLKA